LDYGNVIAHIFLPPQRDYYQLEELWSDAQLVVRIQ
jgi:ribosomal silencing factor RsfS